MVAFGNTVARATCNKKISKTSVKATHRFQPIQARCEFVGDVDKQNPSQMVSSKWNTHKKGQSTENDYL